ncbi:mitochondrial-processing peptidase subunit alpha isoform X2 [Daktulosphaira vitifoliae]|uniref:mitochondrial-processing peptidase subunit alpha isoform X2 n=1 Tax=Daktulosphaira vitifoliae TaxID=58002 RepID=UPI0021A9A7A0|nr:mitochondrial-processing peptidase subunit alpha isoform X2 [Daktulosphaira vitifoliae]
MSSKVSSFLRFKCINQRKSINEFISCQFSSKVQNSCSFQQPPLTEPLPNLPNILYSSPNKNSVKTEITKLSNGIRVATESSHGEFCTVGVGINSGCRYEASYPNGVNHFLEKLAFSSTVNFPGVNQVIDEIEKYNGLSDAQCSRDVTMYAASANRKYVDNIIKVLGDVILRPKITDDEVMSAKKMIQFEHDTLMLRPEQDILLENLVHMAAFKCNTLGMSKLCPLENVEKINRKILMTYLKNHFVPDRIVVGGVGVDHQQLVESVQRYFVEEKPIWSNEKLETIAVDNSIPQYIGGIIMDNCEIPPFPGPSGLAVLSHLVIGLESIPMVGKQQDFVASCVLNLMMGGGGAFSAGGPGKGMYTRLYRNVLNRYGWLFNATAYNYAYVDGGLFCIHSSAEPQYVNNLVKVIVQEMVNMTGSIQREEFLRAKKQLQSLLLMNLEARPIIFEDMIRQVLATGYRKKPEELLQDIENVTEEDIIRIAKQMIDTPLTVVARGDVRQLPAIEEIQELMSMKPRGKFFGRF